jgi:hypothetical protein
VIEPSPQIESLLTAVAANQPASQGVSRAIEAAVERQSEFPSPLAAKLTGITLDPHGRELAEQHLDAYWSQEERRQNTLASTSTGGVEREVIIGSGFHAAVYAAVRVLSGHPRPLVLERDERAGGTFAMTEGAVFTLNSRNRAGIGGPAGDLGASPNFLPGALIQAANLSAAEYQTNTDMALVIRLALAQFAEVVTRARVLSASGTGTASRSGVAVAVEGCPLLFASRLIDARGVGDPADQGNCDGRTALTFPQFMQRMSTAWPLRGIRRVAVIGGGDSAKCAVESLLGIAPQPAMAAAALDTLDLIDWYAQGLPVTCQEWQQQVRGRYQAIGRALRPDRLGRRRLQILNRRARPVTLPGMGLIDGRSYDLLVVCTGNRETPIEGLDPDSFDEYAVAGGGMPGGDPVARKHYDLPVYRVGPHARLPFTARERADGVADIAANTVSMFRTATKTAALAATLPR